MLSLANWVMYITPVQTKNYVAPTVVLFVILDNPLHTLHSDYFTLSWVFSIFNAMLMH